MKLITNLSAGDIPSLKEFIAKQFHEKYILLESKFFDWQYKDNPLNEFKEYAMKVIKFQGKVLGYNGLVPVSFKVFEGNFSGVFFANLMIDEKCRGFGLGATLIRESAREFPICYTMGYNENTKNIYVRLGNWMPLGNLKRFVKVLDGKKAGKLAGNHLPFEETPENDVEDFEFVKVTEFEKSIDLFWQDVKKKYPITVNRSMEYLNWRFSKHPFFKYNMFLCKKFGKIKGFVVLRVEEAKEGSEEYKICRVIDFVSDDSADEFLLNSTIKKMKSQGVHLIDFLFSGNFHIKALHSQGFEEASKKIGYEKIPLLFNPINRQRSFINLIVYAEQYGTRKSEFMDVNNWYVTKADGDQDRPN